MNTQIDFSLNSLNGLQIIIPTASKKFNYYYKPTKKLHQFDEATVYFITTDNKLEIQKEILDDILLSFYGTLKKAISNTDTLPKEIFPGNAGSALNYMLNNLSNINLKPFWMWSTARKCETLLYNQNGRLYLEIAPVYPWTFAEPKPDDSYVTFEDYMRTYKSYVFEEIYHENAHEWLKTLEKYLVLIGHDLQKL